MGEWREIGLDQKFRTRLEKGLRQAGGRVPCAESVIKSCRRLLQARFRRDQPMRSEGERGRVEAANTEKWHHYTSRKGAEKAIRLCPSRAARPVLDPKPTA